jgi:hypothetical protein
MFTKRFLVGVKTGLFKVGLIDQVQVDHCQENAGGML